MSDIFPGATLVQLVEWGYPMGSLRPVPQASQAYSVIHITANLASAQNELAWRLNDPGLQNSATFFVNRDGSIWQALADPFRMDPWTNGDINGPDLSNPRIAAVVQGGVNANERSLITIENVGREPTYPITQAQVNSSGRIIAYYHKKLGLPVNRETVIGHYQINSVDRFNCPSTDKRIIDRIIAAALGGGIPMNLANYTHIKNRKSTFTGAFRADADADAAVLKIFPAGTPFIPFATVTSDTGPWYLLAMYTGNGYRIGAVAVMQCTDLKPIEGGFTQAEVDVAVAAVAEAEKF